MKTETCFSRKKNPSWQTLGKVFVSRVSSTMFRKISSEKSLSCLMVVNNTRASVNHNQLLTINRKSIASIWNGNKATHSMWICGCLCLNVFRSQWITSVGERCRSSEVYHNWKVLSRIIENFTNTEWVKNTKVHNCSSYSSPSEEREDSLRVETCEAMPLVCGIMSSVQHTTSKRVSHSCFVKQRQIEQRDKGDKCWCFHERYDYVCSVT